MNLQFVFYFLFKNMHNVTVVTYDYIIVFPFILSSRVYLLLQLLSKMKVSCKQAPSKIWPSILLLQTTFVG